MVEAKQTFRIPWRTASTTASTDSCVALDWSS